VDAHEREDVAGGCFTLDSTQDICMSCTMKSNAFVPYCRQAQVHWYTKKLAGGGEPGGPRGGRSGGEGTTRLPPLPRLRGRPTHVGRRNGREGGPTNRPWDWNPVRRAGTAYPTLGRFCLALFFLPTAVRRQGRFFPPMSVVAAEVGNHWEDEEGRKVSTVINERK